MVEKTKVNNYPFGPMEYPPPAEQETTITFSRVSKFADIYTCDPTVIRAIYKLTQRNPQDVTLVKKEKEGIFVTMPKSFVKLRPKKKLSDEHKAKVAQNLHRL